MIKQCIVIGALACTSTIHTAKEIELKISLANKKYLLLEKWFKQHAHYSGVSQQTEWYVTSPNDEWDYSAGFKDTLTTIRVRHEAKGDSYCYKYRHLDPVTKKTTHRDEYETPIADGNKMLTYLAGLGYTQTTLVKKERHTYLFNEFEIVVDQVQGIGKFVEIELKEQVDDVKVGLSKIENLLRAIGIAEFVQYDRGYIHMIWNPGYNFGERRNLSNN